MPPYSSGTKSSWIAELGPAHLAHQLERHLVPRVEVEQHLGRQVLLREIRERREREVQRLEIHQVRRGVGNRLIGHAATPLRKARDPDLSEAPCLSIRSTRPASALFCLSPNRDCLGFAAPSRLRVAPATPSRAQPT